MVRTKNIRLHASSYIGQQSYFVTLCCFDRKPIFRNQDICVWLLDIFRTECAARGFAAHAYCIMPDHFHFLGEGIEPTSELLNLVKSFKITTSRAFRQENGEILW